MNKISVEREYLFVYGTLKRGHCREHVLADQEFVSVATTVPQYRMYSCGDYPALVLDECGNEIEGELWMVDEACWRQLDEIEGVAFDLYQRGVIVLQAPYAEIRVTTYFYQRTVDGMTDCGGRWMGV